MKKIVVLAMAFVAATYAEAQIVSSSSTKVEVVQQPETPKPAKLRYVRGGISVMNIGRGDYTDEMSSRIGYDFCAGFQKPLGNKGLYWGMEYGLGSRGFKIKDSEDGYSAELKHIAHNVKWVPFDFGYKHNLKNDFALYAHADVFLSIDYAGKLKYTEKYDGDKESESESIWDLDDYMPFDAGMQFGVGLWWKRLNLDLTYQLGLVDGDTNSDYSFGKYGNFMIRLGVGF